MSFGIKIELNSKEAQRKIRRLINLIDARELLQAIGNRHIRWMDENLKKAGLEKKHQQMADSTIAARPKRSSTFHFSSRYRSRLSQSLVVTLIGTRAVSAGTEDEFAPIHHEGAGPYTIRPVRKKVLKFIGSSGEEIFAKMVSHPGIPARALIPTKQTAERLAIGILDAMLLKKTKQVGL